MDNSKLKVLAVVTLVLGLFGGYLFGSTNGYGRGYTVGYERARGEIKQRLIDTQIIQPAPEEIKIVSGTVRSLGNNQFVLETRAPFDPTLSSSEQGKTTLRTVVVSANTKISIRIVEVSPQKNKPGEPIRPYTVKNIDTNFKAITVGDQIIVEAGENIANKTQFEATLIFLNGK